MMRTRGKRSRLRESTGRQWGDTVHFGRDHEINELRRLYLTDQIDACELDRLLGLAFSRVNESILH